MAYVSVCEWNTDNVIEWLRGLDDAVHPYIQSFQNNDIDGRRVLLLTANDLYNLNITKVGHQELILEAVDLLRELNYSIDSKNLQSLAMKLGCKSRSLYNELKHAARQESRKQNGVNTATLSAVSGILVAVKAMVSWLDCYPFDGQDQYVPIRKTILKLSIELASTAQRDQFAERPQDVIRNSVKNLADLCDQMVQELTDPLILQPAYLDVATVRKKHDEELGIHIQSSYSGIHIVGGVKFNSPAHRCSKISGGDEVVQVNYQTVVGWTLNKFVELLREQATEVVITVKKRPRHANNIGQVIVLKPWRLPLKKKKSPKRGDSNTSPSSDVSNVSKHKQRRSRNLEIEKDSALVPAAADVKREVESQIKNDNVVLRKPRATLKRRVTVSGSSPIVNHPPIRIEDLVNQYARHKEHIERSVSHDPSVKTQNVQPKPPNLRTINSNPESNDATGASPEEATSKSVTIAKLSDQNCSSQSTIVKLRPPNSAPPPSIVLPDSGDEISTMLEDKSLTSGNESNLNHTECGAISSSDARSTNADTGFVSLSESSDSVCDRSSNARSSPSLDTVSSSSNGSHAPKDGKLTTMNASLQSDQQPSQSYQVTIAGGVPITSPTPLPDRNRRSPMLRNKRIRTKLVVGRRISCKDLGQGDCQGWLYKRKVQKSILLSGRWTKRWFVLKNHHLYCYVNIDDPTAESLTYLPGFNVSPAPECKSKKYSFKLYHTGTTFYFATESQQDLSKWMNKMGLAAIAYDASSDVTTSGFLKPEPSLSIGNAYYSETDDDAEDRIRDCPSTNSQSSDSSLASPSVASSNAYMNVPDTSPAYRKVDATVGDDYQPYLNMCSIVPNQSCRRGDERPIKNVSNEHSRRAPPLPVRCASVTMTKPSAKDSSVPSQRGPYMNVPVPKARKESTSSIGSTTSNRPIPAKRGMPAGNTHTYINIPPTSPSYKKLLQQRQSDQRKKASGPTSATVSLTKSTSLMNLNHSPVAAGVQRSMTTNLSFVPSPPCTHPYMNLPSPSPSSRSVPHAFTSYHESSSHADQRPMGRNEFFGLKSDAASPPVVQRCRSDVRYNAASRISASSTHIDHSGYESPGRSSSLDRKELRDISPGIVARLTGSYNRLDKTEVIDPPTNMSAVLSGKLKRRELSPGRVARITGSFDTLGRNAKCDYARHSSVSSVSSCSSAASNRNRSSYQRSLSASHPAMCELSDEEHNGSCCDSLRTAEHPSHSKEDAANRSDDYNNNNRCGGRYKGRSSVPNNYRRHLSVPEGANEFIDKYKNNRNNDKYVSLVDREHRRLYGGNGSDDANNGSVPKSATSQQIQELYSKMRREPTKTPIQGDKQSDNNVYDPRRPMNSSNSSEEYVTPFASPCNQSSYDRQSSGASLQSSPDTRIDRPINPQRSSSADYLSALVHVDNVKPPATFDPPNSPVANVMQAQYVQSPGTVHASIVTLPPPSRDVSNQSLLSQPYSVDNSFVEMGNYGSNHISESSDVIVNRSIPSSKFGVPFVSQPPVSYMGGTPLKVSQIPSRESPETNDGFDRAKMSQAFEMSLDDDHARKKTGAFQFFSSPRFSKKHLRAKSPKPEKKKFSAKNKKSTIFTNPVTRPPASPVQPERTFLGSPRLARAFFGSPRPKKKLAANEDPDRRHDVLLPRRKVEGDVYSRSDSCSSLSSLNSSSNSNVINKPQQQSLTVSIPMGDGSMDEAPCSPDTLRTSVPSMGISVMMGKKRSSTPSSSENSLQRNGRRSATPICKLPNGGSNTVHAFTPPLPSDSSVCQSSDDELVVLADRLIRAKLTIDGVDVEQRRRRTMLQPCATRRQSKRVLELRALERTLKAKEKDVNVIDELLSMNVTPDILEKWMQKNQHLFPSDFEASD